MRIGYGKVGRSMPLSLDKCKTLGGDVEMAAVVYTLAKRNPQHTFVLIGKNDGSDPSSVGLPPNIENPWTEWAPKLLSLRTKHGLKHGNLNAEEQLRTCDIYDKVILPTVMELDGIIAWIGQHGTVNVPMPSIRNRDIIAKPQDWSTYYCAPLLRSINAWRDVDPRNREEIWLNADPRNYLKMRDLKWPLRHPVLAQYNDTHPLKYERYGDDTDFAWWYSPNRSPSDDSTIGPWNVDLASTNYSASEVWRSTVKTIYSRLEVNGLVPGSPFGNLISYEDTWENRKKFGLFINEARSYVNNKKSRLTALQEWVLPLDPDWIHGTWTKKSQHELNMSITSAPWLFYYPLLHSIRCTFTTPSSGSGWATAKPWEAFAAGTVCFFHPLYDDQNHILNDAPNFLKKWLRVSTPKELKLRVDHLNSHAGKQDWEVLIAAQRAHYDKAMSELEYAQIIEQRLFGENK